MKFINFKEKSYLKRILTKSSQLQTDYERRIFLTLCGLERYCSLVQLNSPSDIFINSILATLSKNDITVDNSERLDLILFLEHINQLDSSLSTEDQKFIQQVINKGEQWQASETRRQQSSSDSPQATIASSQNLAEAEQSSSQNTPIGT